MERTKEEWQRIVEDMAADHAEVSRVADQAMDEVERVHANLKAGWKTSEFWVAIGGLVGVVGLDDIDGLFGVSPVLGAIVCVYIIGRSMVKAR